VNPNEGGIIPLRSLLFRPLKSQEFEYVARRELPFLLLVGRNPKKRQMPLVQPAKSPSDDR